MQMLSNFASAYAMNALWQLPLLVLAAEAAARLLAGVRAAVIHRIWASCLIASILLPAAPLLNPNRRPFNARLTIAAMNVASTANSGTPNHAVNVHESAPSVNNKSLPATGDQADPAKVESGQTRAWPRIVSQAITLLYLASVVFALTRLSWKIRRTISLLQCATPAVLPSETQETWLACLAAFNLVRVDLLISPELSSPATLSWPRAAVILPPGLCDSGQEELAAAFCHELAHVRRQDFLLNLVGEALAALLFFHPVLRWLKRRLDESREMACDDLAATAISGRHLYARGLLRLAQAICPLPANHSANCALGVFESGTLEKRVMNLIEPKPMPTASRLCLAATLAATLLIGSLAAGTLLGIKPVSAQVSTQAGTQGPARTEHTPEGWFLAGSNPKSYRTGVDRQMLHKGLPSAYLASKVQETGGFGTLMQSIGVANYAGKRVRLRATVQSKDVADWAGLWMRVDSGEKAVAFDNMQRRAIRGDQAWHVYDVVLSVPQNATGISFGILLNGPGEVWMNGLNFEVVGNDVATTDSADASRSIPTEPINLSFQR